jgi:hypothetical protein
MTGHHWYEIDARTLRCAKCGCLKVRKEPHQYQYGFPIMKPGEKLTTLVLTATVPPCQED